MQDRNARCRTALAFALFSAFALSGVARAETLVGSSVESRVLLGFKVDDAAVAAQLPEGWAPITLPKGPVAGANLLLVFMDRHLVRDADGKAAASPVNRAAALVAYAKKPGVDGVRTFITRVFETGPLSNPYGNSVAAHITHKATSEGSDDGPTHRSESWTLRPEGGGEIAFDLSYEAGTPLWVQDAESRPYSAANPDFHRIYRYDQLADLATNAAAGRALAGTAEFKASVPDLAPVFDGTEQLVAIVSIPVYVRDVYLP
jgi:hypothetical protein